MTLQEYEEHEKSEVFLANRCLKEEEKISKIFLRYLRKTTILARIVKRVV